MTHSPDPSPVWDRARPVADDGLGVHVARREGDALHLALREHLHLVMPDGRPADLLMYGGLLSEPTLIGCAYDLEQEPGARVPPQFLGTPRVYDNAGLCAPLPAPHTFKGRNGRPHGRLFIPKGKGVGALQACRRRASPGAYLNGAGVRVLPPDSPTWCSPKTACDGGGLRATRGGPVRRHPRKTSIQVRSGV